MQVICIKILVPNFFTFAKRVANPTDRLLMPLNKAVHTVLLVLVFFPVGLFAKRPPHRGAMLRLKRLRRRLQNQ
jgi:hypothetical protein